MAGEGASPACPKIHPTPLSEPPGPFLSSGPPKSLAWEPLGAPAAGAGVVDGFPAAVPGAPVDAQSCTCVKQRGEGEQSAAWAGIAICWHPGEARSPARSLGPGESMESSGALSWKCSSRIPKDRHSHIPPNLREKFLPGRGLSPGSAAQAGCGVPIPGDIPEPAGHTPE